MKKKQLLTIGLACLISIIVLFAMFHVLGRSGTHAETASGTLPDAGNSKDSDRAFISASTGISYYLDSFNNPSDYLNNFIATRGDWCDTSTGHASCTGDNLLHSIFVTTPHHGNSGYALALSYNVVQTNSLASYYEHLFDGDWLTGTFHDLSLFDEFRLWMKGEGNTVGDNTSFYVRFADKDWHTGFYEIRGLSSDWQEKKIDFVALRNTPGWQDINWQQMREFTIIFENSRDGSGRVTHPLTGTVYFDDLAFFDSSTRAATDAEFLDLLEWRAFHYFWDYADPATGLIRERASEPEVASIASVGFGLTSICAAKERGWVSHEAAYSRVLTTLDSFYDDPSDPNDLVVSGTHGLFYHFVDIHTGQPRWTDSDGVSTIDSALLMAGVLTVRQCFTETQIVTRATAIYKAADWAWFLNDRGLIRMCWTPEKQFVCPREPGSNEWDWEGYNEGLILYLLAIGSPTHPVPPESWDKWAATYQWGAYYGYPILLHAASPLFAHQYPQAWVDFRGKKDSYVNYFRNSRYVTLANRAYSIDDWYPAPPFDVWGFTASDGPITNTCAGKSYVAYGYPPDPGVNNGTIAPTAAGGSIVFTPKESILSLRYMVENYQDGLWGLFGLKDSFNVKCEPGWFDNDYIGIDVGAMQVMIENHRSGLIWDTFMRNQEITQAMDLARFVPDDTSEPPYFYYREAETYNSVSGITDTFSLIVETHSKAWGQKTLQIGPYEGNSASYVFHATDYGGDSVFFQARYSDDVRGNVIDVYLDGVKRDHFTTDRFGGWDDFGWDDEVIHLGIITPGVHTLTMQVAEGGGGSFGVNLDVFRIYTWPVYLPLVQK